MKQSEMEKLRELASDWEKRYIDGGSAINYRRSKELLTLIDSMEVIEDDCDCKKIIQLKNGDWVCQYCGYNFGKDAPTLQAEQEADDSAEL